MMQPACLILTLLAQTAPGTAPFKDRAVDQIVLKDGRRLFGVALADQPKGVSLLVSGVGFKKADPAGHARETKRLADAWEREADDRLERLRKWRELRANAPRLTAQIDDWLEKLADGRHGRPDPDALANPSLMVLEFPADQVAKKLFQSPDRRTLAVAAFAAELDDVETRSTNRLIRELTAGGRSLTATLGDLSGRIIPRPDSPAVWSARQAVIEHRLVDPVEFQGTGSTFFEVKEGAPPDLTELFPKLLAEATKGLTDGLLDADPGAGARRPAATRPDGGWWAEVVKTARVRDRDVRGVKVTRLTIDLAAGTVLIEVVFLGRIGDRLVPIHADSERGRIDGVSRDELAALRDDPSVKKALSLAQSLGGGDAIERALRFGAATGKAKQVIDERFETWRIPILHRIDAPLIVPGE
jgi:hypothetical protein